jgi:hypothetical protein
MGYTLSIVDACDAPRTGTMVAYCRDCFHGMLRGRQQTQRMDDQTDHCEVTTLPGSINAPYGLGALFRLGASKPGHPFTRIRGLKHGKIFLKPTECPPRFGRSFPPGSARTGHFAQLNGIETQPTPSAAACKDFTKPTECPSRFGRSFPPGSAQTGAFFLEPLVAASRGAVAHAAQVAASQKDARQAWVDFPPNLPRPGRPKGFRV